MFEVKFYSHPVQNIHNNILTVCFFNVLKQQSLIQTKTCVKMCEVKAKVDFLNVNFFPITHLF